MLDVRFKVMRVRKDEAFTEVDTPDGKDHFLSPALVVLIEIVESDSFAPFKEGVEYVATLRPCEVLHDP